MATGFVYLVMWGMYVIWIPFTVWFMVRALSLMQRMAVELEAIARSQQSR